MEQSIKVTITSVAIASNGAVFTDAEECAYYERAVAAIKEYENRYGEKRGKKFELGGRILQSYPYSLFPYNNFYPFTPKDV